MKYIHLKKDQSATECRLDIPAALDSLTYPTCSVLITGAQSFSSSTVMLRSIFLSASVPSVNFAMPFNCDVGGGGVR